MIHKFLNVVSPILSIILLFFLIPMFWLVNLLRFCFKSVYPEQLSGKVMIITGASAGIGEQLAIQYAKEGVCLALVARREKQLQIVAKNAMTMGSPDVIVIPANVSKLEDCKRIVDETIKYFGKLDYLVNNAAIGAFGLFEDQTCISDQTSIMDVNFWGSVYTTHFAIPHLRRNKGKIIAICSSGSLFRTPRVTIYNSSKAAMQSFFETLRIEVGPDIGIAVITPGVVETNLSNDEWLEEGNARWIPRVSAKRCAEAIVKSTRRGDKYLTEPSWVKMVLLWKTLCPEIVNPIMNFAFITWPKRRSSNKTKKPRKVRFDQSTR